MEPSNPDKNKLKIKLKFQTKKPTPPPVDDDELKEGELELEPEPEPEEVVNTNKRVCPHCSKEFSNGKALGGHLRIHAIEKDYKSAKKQKFVVGSSSGNREFWCNICHRRYHSEKALYGHMRSHPDRKYRGMEPPNGFVTEDEDEDEDEDDNDGGVRELRWKVTGKRGQKIMDSTTMEVGSSSFEAAATELMLYMANSVGVSKDEDEDEDEDENENEGEFMKKVKRLVREKLGKKKMEEKKSGIKKEKLEEIEGILKEKGLKIEEFDEDELYFLQDDLGISGVFADDYYNSDSSLASWNDKEIVVVSTKSDKKKKEKKKRKRVSGLEPGFERPNKKHHKKDDDDGDGGDDDNNGYSPQTQTQTQTPLDWSCCTCGKIFNSHQALGGHRSSHNKKNYSKSSLALTLAQDALTLAQDPIQIDQRSGLTDVGPGSRSGSGEFKSVIEVGESSSRSPPVPAQTIHTPAQTSSQSTQTSSPSAQTSSPPLGQSDRLPYMIDLNVSLMDEEEGVIDSGF